MLFESFFLLTATIKQCFFRALDQKFANLATMIEVLSKIVSHVNELFSDRQTLTNKMRVALSEQVSVPSFSISPEFLTNVV